MPGTNLHLQNYFSAVGVRRSGLSDGGSGRGNGPGPLPGAVTGMGNAVQFEAPVCGGGFLFADGSVYVGDTDASGRMRGVGLMQEAAQQYEGNWDNGVRHGQGVQFWLTGHRYTGGFVNGQRCGSGTLVLPVRARLGDVVLSTCA